MLSCEIRLPADDMELRRALIPCFRFVERWEEQSCELIEWNRNLEAISHHSIRMGPLFSFFRHRFLILDNNFFIIVQLAHTIGPVRVEIESLFVYCRRVSFFIGRLAARIASWLVNGIHMPSHTNGKKKNGWMLIKILTLIT